MLHDFCLMQEKNEVLIRRLGGASAENEAETANTGYRKRLKDKRNSNSNVVKQLQQGLIEHATRHVMREDHDQFHDDQMSSKSKAMHDIMTAHEPMKSPRTMLKRWDSVAKFVSMPPRLTL